MTSRKAAVAGIAAAAMLLFEPVRSFAATTTDCNPPVVPESPMGPALLIVAALGALALVAYRRRRRGVTATLVSTMAVVMLCASLLGTVLASAATTSCPGGGSTSPGGQGVLGTTTSTSNSNSASTPLTGADIPWITGGVLVLSGAVFIAVSPRRRHRSGEA
jgi:hypothetical protein